MSNLTPVNSPNEVTLRPTSGKVLTVAIGLFAAVGLFSFVYRGIPRDTLQFSLLAVAVVYLCWLLFWYPSVSIGPSGVTVVNPFRSYRVSWPAILDVRTRYALTLFLHGGAKVVAWSAPSPSRYAGINTVRADLTGLSGPIGDRSQVDASRRETSVPLGDIPNSESGITALHVRRAWIALQDAGYLDSGVIEGTGLTTTWNARALLIGGGLVALGLLAAVLIH
jgi:hypothetical protein